MSNVLFLEQYSYVEGPKSLISIYRYILMIFTYTFEDFVKFTLDFPTDFVRKGRNMAFGG